MDSVIKIFDKFRTDKNSSWHNYGRQYEDLFRYYRDKPIKYLEIGVFEGESLKAMREVFKNAIYIVGIDINPECHKYQNPDDNIFIEIGDVKDTNFLNNIITKYGCFDIILDDGSHINKDVIIAFDNLFPLLNDKGIYIIEDSCCYQSEEHIIDSYPNHINYIIPLIKHINQWRFDYPLNETKDQCVDPFKIYKKTNDKFEYSIDKIEFGVSYIAIHKLIRHHWIS